MSREPGSRKSGRQGERPAPAVLYAETPEPKAARPAGKSPSLARIEVDGAVASWDIRAIEVPGQPGDLDGYVMLAQEIVSRGEHPRLGAEALSPHWRERFSEEELNAVVIPRRTLARRVRFGEPLTTEETDRALRLARIATQADRVFGDRDKATRWLRKPNRAAGQQAPITLLETETGAKLVEDLLVRIEHGIIG